MPSNRSLPSTFRSAIVAFFLTLAISGIALYTGAVTRGIASLQESVDTQVVLLFVPLCALVFAMVFEVVRMSSTTTLPTSAAEPRRIPVGWHPGHGEG